MGIEVEDGNITEKPKGKIWVVERLRITLHYFLYTPAHISMCYSMH